GEGPPSATPVPDTNTISALLNALFYVAIAFIGAFVIFLIIKSGKMKILKIIFASSIAITSFFFIFLLTLAVPYYLGNLFWGITAFSTTTYWVIFSLGIVFGLAYSILTILSMVYEKTPQPLPQIMAMLFAVLAGTYLATFLPTLVSIFVMIGLSIYDIISVFRGPIKKIAEISEERYNDQMNNETTEESLSEKEVIGQLEEESTEQLENNAEIDSLQDTVENDPPESLSQNMEDSENEITHSPFIELGLGDLAFFGMLFSFALVRLGFFSATAAFVGVIIGAVGTIKLLEKTNMMPGLPLSIGLGLILAFLVWGILALSGYSGWGWNNPEWFGTPI
ncbi:hypothetical protein EU523_01555, partial [Candidatus Heimdallarchaeota archaeon]